MAAQASQECIMSKILPIIGGFGGRTVLWVDDRVQLTIPEQEQIKKVHPSVDVSALWPMNENWKKAVRNSEDDFVAQDADYQKSATAITKLCEKYRYNLTAADFRAAHELVREDNQSYLFLLDLQNLTEPMGYTTLADGTSDASWNWEVYGAVFAKHHRIPAHRFRFCTRYSRDTARQDAVVAACRDLVSNDTAFVNQSIPLSIERGVAERFEEFLKLNSFHEDPAINDAIVFTSAPPHFPYWNHNELQPTHNGVEGRHNKALRTWLAMDSIDEHSAKALMYSGVHGWRVNPTKSGRQIAGSVIGAACRKIGFDLEVDSNKRFRLPSEPGIPFLIALGNVIWQMRECERTHPPTKITLSQIDGQHCVRLELNPNNKKDATPINMDKFETLFRSRKGNETCARLRELEQVKVFQENPLDGDPAKCFSGTTKNAVTIDFDKSRETPAVLIKW